VRPTVVVCRSAARPPFLVGHPPRLSSPSKRIPRVATLISGRTGSQPVSRCSLSVAQACPEPAEGSPTCEGGATASPHSPRTRAPCGSLGRLWRPRPRGDPIRVHPRLDLPFRVPQASACSRSGLGGTGFQPVNAAQPPPIARPICHPAGAKRPRDLNTRRAPNFTRRPSGGPSALRALLLALLQPLQHPHRLHQRRPLLRLLPRLLQ